MSDVVALIGAPGIGKTTSVFHIPELNIKGLDSHTNFFISCGTKNLIPPEGNKYKKLDVATKEGNYFQVESFDSLNTILLFVNKNPNFKTIVIDDFQFLMSLNLVSRISEKSYDKFTELGSNVINTISKLGKLREDLTIFVLTHIDTSDNDEYKMKTFGKMLESWATPESLFPSSIVLYAVYDPTEESYKFLTNRSGKYPARSPHGMFKEKYIPNDLGYVLDQIQGHKNKNFNQ